MNKNVFELSFILMSFGNKWYLTIKGNFKIYLLPLIFSLCLKTIYASQTIYAAKNLDIQNVCKYNNSQWTQIMSDSLTLHSVGGKIYLVILR